MCYANVMATLAVIIDIGILIILIMEFNYDKTVYEKEQFHKRRRKKPEFDALTTGEMK